MDSSTHTKSRYQFIAPLYNLMEWPVEQLWYQKWRQKLWQQIRGPKVLEIGVGTGKNIPYYPDNIELTGIDLSPAMLKRAQKLLHGHQKDHIRLVEMDAQEMNFQNQTFDEVVATFVFCSVPDPVRGLEETIRVTKAGGRLHLLEHMRPDKRLLGLIMDKLDAPIHYLSGVHISRQTIVNVEKAGWNIDKIEDLTGNGIFKKIEAIKPY